MEPQINQEIPAKLEMSASIKSIAAALFLFQSKMGKILKESRNDFVGNAYASLPHVLESIIPILQESGLVFTQFPIGKHSLTTLLAHPQSGEWIRGSYEMTPLKQDPQGVGSAITYMRRYALSAVLGLNIDKDDDGNGASNKGRMQAQPGRHVVEKPVNGTSVTEQSTDKAERAAPVRSAAAAGPVPQKPWLNKGTKEWDGAIEKLKAGTTTIDKIKTVRRISRQDETALLNAVNS